MSMDDWTRELEDTMQRAETARRGRARERRLVVSGYVLALLGFGGLIVSKLLGWW